MSKLQRKGDMVHTAGKVTEPLIAALVNDERCFYMIDPYELWQKLQFQIQAEQTYTNAVGAQLSPNQVAKEYRVFDFPVNSAYLTRNGLRKRDGIRFDLRCPLVSEQAFSL